MDWWYYGALGTAADTVQSVEGGIAKHRRCPLRGPARFRDAGMTYEKMGGIGSISWKENISDKTGQIMRPPAEAG